MSSILLLYLKSPESGPNWRARGGGGFRFSSILSQINKKRRGPFGELFFKKSHNAGKTERGTPSGFFNIHFVAKVLKTERGSSVEIFFEEEIFHNAKKSEKGDPLVSPSIDCYAEKRKTLFDSVPWASRYNFKFCRTFGRTIMVTSGVSEKNTDEKP